MLSKARCRTYFGQGSWCRFGQGHGKPCQPGRLLISRTLAYVAVGLLTALPAFARWESCPSTCTPPSATATGLSRLPLYASAKFSDEVKMAGNPMWTWTKVAPTTCTPAQLANRDDAFVCNAAVGVVVMRTVRVRDTGKALTAERTALDPEVPFTRGTIRHCPMRLPDSAYTAEEREQCRVLDVLNGERRRSD